MIILKENDPKNSRYYDEGSVGVVCGCLYLVVFDTSGHKVTAGPIS